MSDLSLSGDDVLHGAHVALDPDVCRAAAAFVRAHDPNPDDLLEALGIGGAA